MWQVTYIKNSRETTHWARWSLIEDAVELGQDLVKWGLADYYKLTVVKSLYDTPTIIGCAGIVLKPDIDFRLGAAGRASPA